MKIGEVIKQVKFRDSYHKALVNLIYTSNWLRDANGKVFREHDILSQHYNVLRIIKGKHPEPISPGEIKEVMLDKASDVTRLIDKLVAKGLVNRGLCEANRRKMDVTITPAGEELIQTLEKPINKLHNQLKKRISPEEAEQLSTLLDTLRG